MTNALALRLSYPPTAVVVYGNDTIKLQHGQAANRRRSDVWDLRVFQRDSHIRRTERAAGCGLVCSGLQREKARRQCR